jgi:hypothetical protein
MVRKSRKEIKKLQSELYSLKWEKVDVHASGIDPDMKAIYLNDIDYKAYCIQQRIDDLEHEEAMFPLKLMLAGFIIFTLVLVLYRISH